MAVLEALAMACPVVITPACSFPQVPQLGCGLVVDPTESEVAQALRGLLSRSPEERAAMGAKGAELVRSRYSWPVIGRQMAEVYDWLLGERSMPETVHLAHAKDALERECTA